MSCRPSSPGRSGAGSSTRTAALLDLAAGQPFTPAQILWINFAVNAPFGVALGFDEETPGLMTRQPRPRGQSILTPGVTVTSGLGGLYLAAANLILIAVGVNHYGDLRLGRSIGLVGFTLMLVVAAFEARSETETVFRLDTFNSPRMNRIAALEVVGAVLITQADFLRRLLGTRQVNARQWGIGLLSAVVLLVLWEAGKFVARRRRARSPVVVIP